LPPCSTIQVALMSFTPISGRKDTPRPRVAAARAYLWSRRSTDTTSVSRPTPPGRAATQRSGRRARSSWPRARSWPDGWWSWEPQPRACDFSRYLSPSTTSRSAIANGARASLWSCYRSLASWTRRASTWRSACSDACPRPF
jgi:hypothetical protein